MHIYMLYFTLTLSINRYSTLSLFCLFLTLCAEISISILIENVRSSILI